MTPSTYAAPAATNIPDETGSIRVSIASATIVATAPAIDSCAELGRRARTSMTAAAVPPPATPSSAPLTTRNVRW